MEKKWNQNLNILKEFYVKFGRLPKVNEQLNVIKIGYWLFHQRKINRKSNLSFEKIIALKEISEDIFNDLNDIWYNKLELLGKFYKEFGRLPYQEEIYENVKIGSWLGTQRGLLKKNELNVERTKSLLKISDNIFKYYDDTWNDRLSILQEFYDKFGRLPTREEIFSNINKDQIN